jgi:hypothetical protein
VCSGPSLTGIDLSPLQNHVTTITVNGSWRAANWADFWFTGDPWGIHGPQLPPESFTGALYAAISQDHGTGTALSIKHRREPSERVSCVQAIFDNNYEKSIKERRCYGLSEDCRAIAGGNSGYGALNMAYLMRPRNIVIFGLDGNSGYFYNTGETNRDLDHLPEYFESSVDQLKAKGIQVINASPESKITCFPKVDPTDAIDWFSGKAIKGGMIKQLKIWV